MKKTIKTFSIMFVAFFLFFAFTNVKAADGTEYEENLIKRIAPDGINATLKTVRPINSEESDIMLTSLFSKLINEKDYFVYGSCEESDLSDCTVGIYDNRGEEGGGFSKEYDIRVTYDEPTSNSVINNYRSKIKTFNSADLNTFYLVEDLGLINYYMTSVKSELWNPGAAARALKYSDEIIKLTNGGNISFSLDPRKGVAGEDYMYEFAIGGMNIYYNDYCYGTQRHGLHLRKVIYIPQSTEETEEAYIEAAKRRINEYLGEDNDITITYGGELESLIIYTGDPEYPIDETVLDETVDSEDTDGNYYNITIKGKTYKFYIIKGTDEQLVAPEYLGSDIKTEIIITSSNSSIPLDTLLTVNNVVNNKIKEVLSTSDYKAFDISLYSNSNEKSIEKLENGKFLVSIPVPEEYEGKELVIYYINSEDKTEKHNVTVKDGIASFETDHFSTYILTPLSSDSEIQNPQTGDNVVLYIVLGVMSVIGLTGSGLLLNRKKTFN